MNLQFDWPLALVLLTGIPLLALWQVRGRQARPAPPMSNLAGAVPAAPTWRVRLRRLPPAPRLRSAAPPRGAAHPPVVGSSWPLLSRGPPGT